jgi:hypothetical protein
MRAFSMHLCVLPFVFRREGLQREVNMRPFVYKGLGLGFR